MMCRNIAIMVGSYYPNYSAVGKCMANIADVLVDQGQKVSVISMHSLQNSPRKESVNGETIIRIDWDRSGIDSNNKVNGALLIVRFLFGTDGTRKACIKAHLDGLNQLDEKPDIIIPVCAPFESVLASLYYKREHERIVVPFFSSFKSSYALHVHLYSYGNAQQLVDEAASAGSRIVSHGLVPTDAAHAAIKGADILLSIGNMNTVQYPSKIFEYISVGKPIIHFVLSSDDAVVDVLKRYPNSCIVYADADDLDSERRKLGSFLTKTDVKRLSYDEVSRIYPEACPKTVVDNMMLELK